MIRIIVQFFERLYPLQAVLVLVCALMCAFVSSCSNSPLAPVTDLSIRSKNHQKPHAIPRNGVHIVQKGETLFSIAWRYGLDHKKIANFNKINPPSRIFPGQRLSLDKRPIKVASLSTKATKKPKKNRYIADSYKKPASNKKQIHKKDSQDSLKSVNIDWTWPAGGKVIERFSVKGIGNKGLDISGSRGERVTAAAKGKVVYSGSGLRGYGNLIIIKHNDVFLSAYAHNSRILVKEGDVVKASEKIAEIGSSDTDRNKLHFEIRRRGKPVNPISYLPRR